MQRWAICVEYDGSQFQGFQRQAGEVPTVQAALEAGLSRLMDHPVTSHCAGRTDRGVHATGQVVHFDARHVREPHQILRGGNTLTPGGIHLHWAYRVSADFHARFSATSRTYLYLLSDRTPAGALMRDRVVAVPGELQLDDMERAAQRLIGEHDFSSFRAAGCQARTPWRNVQEISVERIWGYVGVRIRANAFLQHMVRNIIGALLQVGSGQRSADDLEALLHARDRTAAPATAPPGGLYLVDVGYPAEFELPARTRRFPEPVDELFSEEDRAGRNAG